jgi:hypothetical protein
MDVGLLVRLCAFPHDVAAPEPVRPCVRVLPRLRQRDAVFPRIYADRSTNPQAQHMGLPLFGKGFADHCLRTATANPKLRRSRSCTTLGQSRQAGLANDNITPTLVIGFVGAKSHECRRNGKKTNSRMMHHAERQ